MDPYTAMQSLLRGTAKTLLLLVVIVLTAECSTLPPSTQPRLERTDITVLSIECRVPYHTAWMEGWNIPFAELQVLYRGRYLNDKPEVVANLTSRNTKPATYGRFRDADLFTATSVQLPETVEGCHSCRKIRVLMAVSGPAYYGYYSCEAKSTGKNSRAIYTALVDEQFVSHPQTKVNGTLTVESIRADEIHITWNDKLVKSSGSGEVSVERTVVDKEGQLLDNEATYILFRTVKDKPVLYENHGTLLFTKSGPDSEGQSEVRLVVETDTLSSPLWRYSCQVSGNDCHRDSKSHTATPKDCDCKCGSTGLVIGLSVGLGIVSFLLIIVVLVCCFVFLKLRQGYSPIPMKDVREQTPQGSSPTPVTENRRQTPQDNFTMSTTENRRQTPQDNFTMSTTENRRQTPQDNSTMSTTENRRQTPQDNFTMSTTENRRQTPQDNSTMSTTENRRQTPQDNSTMSTTENRRQTPQDNSTMSTTENRRQTPQDNSTMSTTDDRRQTPQDNSSMSTTENRRQTPQDNSTMSTTDDRRQTPQDNSTMSTTENRRQTPQDNSTMSTTENRRQTPQDNSTMSTTENRRQTPQDNSTMSTTDDRPQPPQDNSTENTGGMHAATGITPLRADRTPDDTGKEIHDDNNIHNVDELAVFVVDQTTQSDDNDVSTYVTRDRRAKRRKTD